MPEFTGGSVVLVIMLFKKCLIFDPQHTTVKVVLHYAAAGWGNMLSGCYRVAR